MAELPIVPFSGPAEWRGWLEEHPTADGVWVKLAKKGSGIPTVTYAEAVEVALCHGWIDGQSRRLDERYHLQRFTPRRARSVWSKLNRAKAEALIESGAIGPAGLREVERAKADGRWAAAYDPPSTATVPDDLQQALDRNTKARAFFATLDSQNRHAILHRIQGVKRSETRARNIDKFVAMLAAGEKIYS
ncbi:MAG: YdeI/OmpD-associated family protein [Gaiellaceae bacterium MAG52_C11]|nr:YdeI/OmpD-associated family protein [Candidatus Gaiellasilicea maunaloa]